MSKHNRETLTLSVTGRIARLSKQLERLSGERLDSENIVPLVATGVRAKSASRVSYQRARAERDNLPTEQWEITVGGKTTTVGAALETDTGRDHIESQIKSHFTRSETDSRRGAALQKSLRRALRAENKKLKSEIARLNSER